MELPNINDPDSIADKIATIEIFGEHDRTYPKPNQYIQPLSDFFSQFQIRQAVQCLFKGSMTIDGMDGFLIGYSRDQIIVQENNGNVSYYRKSVPTEEQ